MIVTETDLTAPVISGFDAADPDNNGKPNVSGMTLSHTQVGTLVLSKDGVATTTTGTSATDTTITDNSLGVPAADRVNEKDYGILLPSASLRWKLSDSDRITASVARTVRRPNFDFISPALLEGEYGDNDFLGNPDLEPEKTTVLEAIYERRFWGEGVFDATWQYAEVEDVVDVIPLTGGFDGVGNIGDGTASFFQLRLTLPTDTTIAVSLQNIFNEDPPFARLDQNYDPFTASPLGFTAKIAVSQAF